MTTLGDFTATGIDGTDTDLAAYQGQVVLVVNTASQCGFTPQYQGLQELHRAYAARGFSVLGFLLVYGLVALASLRVPLAGNTLRRRALVGGGCLLAVLAVAIGYLWGVVGHQNGLVLSFMALMAIGAALVKRRLAGIRSGETP